METETRKIYRLDTRVSFGDVDRDNLLSLRGVFKLLQEVAIAHANLFDTGTEAMLTRGESWVLNRLAVEIRRYPAYGDPLHIETWSSGIRGFRGYRDFRIMDSQGRLIITGSSLWVFVNIRTQSIMRVPRELAERFPSVPGDVFCPDLETRDTGRMPEGNTETRITLRYSDFDANHHVNNTAYLDLLQAALSQQQAPARPGQVLIKYGKAIPDSCPEVGVRLGPLGEQTCFSITVAGETFAQGLCGPCETEV
jgi:acyl-ACP thioesterase